MEEISLRELIGFSDKQQEAFDDLDKYKYLLYGGAMGGGKSYWIRWTLVWYLSKLAKKYNKFGIAAGLFCEDYPSLKDRQISKMASEFPDWLGDMHADHKEWGRCFIARQEYGGWIICLRNLDDASKYKSAEFAVIAIDELTKNKRETFDDLKTRLRWSGISGFDCKFISGTNPGEIGHAWVKKWWLDRDFEEEMKEESELYGYIQAKAEDNGYLDSAYLKTLDSLPLDKRRAYRDGDWDIFKGQYFSEFRREIHVIKPRGLYFYNKKIICGDYGYSAPSAVYWLEIDGDGYITVYRELYKTNLTYENLTKEIISLTGNDENISYWVFDPAIWAKKGETELSGAEIMMQTYRNETNKGVILQKANNDRINGWGLVREYLKTTIRNGKVEPKLQIFDTCPDLIRTLPALVYDAHKIEDVDTDGEDHGPDAIRYGLMSRPPKGAKDDAGDILAINRTITKPKISLK